MWYASVCTTPQGWLGIASQPSAGKTGRCSSRCQPGRTPGSSELVTYTHWYKLDSR